MEARICQVHRLGMVEYTQAWRLQEQWAGEIARGERPDTLLLLEHPHTYTFGRSGQAQNLLWGAAELERRSIVVHWVDRGGDVTYHGPGQLVGYPLLTLVKNSQELSTSLTRRVPRLDYIGYLRQLEQVLILTLESLGVAAQRLEGKTGVWVAVAGDPGKPAKIASIGIKVDGHGISRHGFALNVNPDMSYWDGIIPCGLRTDRMTSIGAHLNPVPTMEQVMDVLVTHFGEVLGYKIMDDRR